MPGSVTGLPEGKGTIAGESGDLGSSGLGWSQGVVPAEMAFRKLLNLEGQGGFTRVVSPLSPEQKLVWCHLERQASRGIAL